MKAVLQRVSSASVSVNNEVVGSIGRGVVVLAAVAKGDTAAEAEAVARKVLRLKMFDDEAGARWKRSVQDIGGEVLCVSQFTLLASTKKGNKPDFHRSAAGDAAKEVYERFFAAVQNGYRADRVKNGVFQAMMDVALVNDGPVTLEVDVEPPKEQQATASAVPTDSVE